MPVVLPFAGAPGTQRQATCAGGDMRIAVTGTHGSGKSTLIDDFLDGHRSYEHQQEPYWELAQQGVVFSDGPVVADLAEQLEQSSSMLLASASVRDVIFDRCPIDFIAYLDVMSAKEGYEWTPSGKQLSRLEKAVATLDLLVFLPLADPDEILTKIEYPGLRRAVDGRLKRLLQDDELGLIAGGPRLVEIIGSRADRVAALSRYASVSDSP
jgi:hypothetical protein